MKNLRLLAIGDVARPMMDAVRGSLAREFGMRCAVDATVIDPSFAYYPQRNQYHSTQIVEKLQQLNGDQRLLGITSVDLFIPILTFVFGEAQLGGTCAVVSYHRLDQSFYGLEADEDLLVERLVKEAIHEVGHTFGLTHCEDYECVMAASHSVEWLDVKGSRLCPECRPRCS